MALVQQLGTGRRKRAVARVFLRPGTGVITVNGKINAMNLVSLQAKDVNLSGARIYAGEVARAEFAKITNVAGLGPATAFAVTDGAIRIVALSSSNTSPSAIGIMA